MTTVNVTMWDGAVYAARRRRLGAAFDALGIDAILVTHDRDVEYLCGLPGHDVFVIMTSDRCTLITDNRLAMEMEAFASRDGFKVEMGTRHRLLETVADLVRSGAIRRLGIQGDHVSVAMNGDILAAIGDTASVATRGVLASLRQVKDASEVALIEEAIDVQCAALDAALGALTPGMTEHDFAALLEYEVRRLGASGGSFPFIIATGANGARPHHTPSQTPISPGMLLIDWGAVIGGYCSDLTRTYALGAMPEPMGEIYEIVLEAQLAAIDAIEPGKTCAEIDHVARQVIVDAGYGPQFGHGLGHGLGMDVHESPYFNDLETSRKLEPGMVMTVEPGIYLPGVGGVRIEDDILVTQDGVRVLSKRHKDRESMILEWM
jgi:Xaa-Pro aminopeptidase